MVSLEAFIKQNGLEDQINLGLEHITKRFDVTDDKMKDYGLHGFVKTFWAFAKIKWKVESFRSRAILGRCSHAKKIIEINEQLLLVGREMEMKSTLIHEIAHMVVQLIRPYLVYLKISNDAATTHHGKLWKFVAISLGDDGQRTADYEFFSEYVLEERAKKGHKHEYKCKDCGHIYKTFRELTNVHRRRHGECKYRANGGHLEHKMVR